ncbi:MAG: hypothetical protein ABSG68_08690 [Thermoguttaceae bacterium]|jgi:hypothetical protein
MPRKSNPPIADPDAEFSGLAEDLGLSQAAAGQSVEREVCDNGPTPDAPRPTLPAPDYAAHSRGLLDKAAAELGLLTIHVPLGALPDPPGYLPKHIEVNNLSMAQRLSLRRMLAGLDAAGARLANSRRVTTTPDVLRWLLEQLD